MLFACLFLLVITAVYHARDETLPKELLWVSVAILFVACIIQSVAEFCAREKKKSLDLAANNAIPGGKKRLRPLLETQQLHLHKLRQAMFNIIDTFTEHVYECIHQADNRLEHGTKAFVFDGIADKLTEDNDWVDWENKWKGIGKRMEVPEGAYHDAKAPRGPREVLTVEFGDTMRRCHFGLAPAFLNAASYGAMPLSVIQAQEHWIRLVQRNPVDWRFKALPSRLRQAEVLLSSFLNSDPEDTKLLANANAATSTIFKSLPWQCGDRLLLLSCDYDATKHAARYLTRTHGVEIVEVPVDPSMSDDNILSVINKKLEDMKTNDRPLPVLCNFCHVTSKTAWVFPAKRITDLLHRYVSVL